MAVCQKVKSSHPQLRISTPWDTEQKLALLVETGHIGKRVPKTRTVILKLVKAKEAGQKLEEVRPRRKRTLTVGQEMRRAKLCH